ncbi:MAG: DUF1805 domain-containing protein [Verrucomicrobiota bacterium]
MTSSSSSVKPFWAAFADTLKTAGIPSKTVDDLLAVAVKDVNEAAKRLGVQAGMTGRQALEKM